MCNLIQCDVIWAFKQFIIYMFKCCDDGRCVKISVLATNCKENSLFTSRSNQAKTWNIHIKFSHFRFEYFTPEIHAMTSNENKMDPRNSSIAVKFGAMHRSTSLCRCWKNVAKCNTTICSFPWHMLYYHGIICESKLVMHNF